MKKYFTGILLVAAFVLVSAPHAHAAQFCAATNDGIHPTISCTEGQTTCGAGVGVYSCHAGTWAYAGTGLCTAGSCGALTVGGTNSDDLPSMTFSQCQTNIGINGGGNCCATGADSNGNTTYNWQTAACGVITAGSGSSTGLTPILNWTLVPNATYYNVSVATDANFSNVISNTKVIGNSYRLISPKGAAMLKAGTTYYWRVQAGNTFGVSAFSPVWKFSTASGASSTGTVAIGTYCEQFPNAPGCSIVGAALFTPDLLLSGLYGAGAHWATIDGKKIVPTSIKAVIGYYDENGMRVFPDPKNSTMFDLLANIGNSISGGSIAAGNNGGVIPPGITLCNPAGFNSPTCTCTFNSIVNNWVVGGGPGCAISAGSSSPALQ